MSEYFPMANALEGKVKIELYLSNYAAKTDLMNATGVATSKLAMKIDLDSLKSDTDKLDIEKLEKVSTGLISFKSKVDKLDVDRCSCRFM